MDIDEAADSDRIGDHNPYAGGNIYGEKIHSCFHSHPPSGEPTVNLKPIQTITKEVYYTLAER